MDPMTNRYDAGMIMQDIQLNISISLELRGYT
jgi:hypothetical protein